MYKILLSNAFQKELTKAFKQHKSIEKLFNVISLLANKNILPENFHNHKLQGEFEGTQECHVESDWLLIYRINEPKNEIIICRLGYH